MLDDEIRHREAAKLGPSSMEPSLTGLDQWFQQYGRPKAPPPGFLTTFENDKKIYGGTAHHRAYRTQARTMKRGIGLR